MSGDGGAIAANPARLYACRSRRAGFPPRTALIRPLLSSLVLRGFRGRRLRRLLGPGQGRCDQSAEQRVGPVGARLEFGVGLSGGEEGVLGSPIISTRPPVRGSGGAHAGRLLQAGAVGVVDLIAVPVALAKTARRVEAPAREPGV